MATRARSRVLSWFLLLSCGTLLAAGTGLSPTPRQDDDHEELEKHMVGLDDALKMLRETIVDPARRDESLTLIGTMEGHAVGAKAEKPPLLEDIPEAERAEVLAGYRLTLAKLVRELSEMEIELLEGKDDAAAARITTIRKMKKAGHNEYQ